MGASVSDSTANGFIFIKTEKPHYLSGDKVRGNVYLNLLQYFPGNTVFVKVKGKETTKFQSQQKNQEQKTGEKNLIKHKTIIHEVPGLEGIPPGQYDFPFMFTLPNSLPGSFHEHVPSQKYEASIHYSICAWIAPTNQNKKMKKIKHKQELVIREFLQEKMVYLTNEIEAFPHTWWLISHGSMRIQCHFQRSSYLPGETAQFITEIDNSKCTVPITRIECSLHKKVVLKSFSGSSVQFEEVVNDFMFPGVGAGELAMGSTVKVSTIPLVHKIDGKPICPSSNGRIVQCHYYLLVKAIFPGTTCCIEYPHMEIDIQIVEPPPEQYGKEKAPLQWSPQVYKPVNVDLNERDETNQIENPEIINYNYPFLSDQGEVNQQRLPNNDASFQMFNPSSNYSQF